MSKMVMGKKGKGREWEREDGVKGKVRKGVC